MTKWLATCWLHVICQNTTSPAGRGLELAGSASCCIQSNVKVLFARSCQASSDLAPAIVKVSRQPVSWGGRSGGCAQYATSHRTVAWAMPSPATCMPV